jgi:hypothetical protein
MKTFALLSAFLCLFLLTGCGAQPGHATMTLARGKTPPPPAEALDSGIYAVYDSHSTTPIYTLRLNEGDQYGFRKDEKGNTVAFANTKGKDLTIPLENSLATSYIWKFQGDQKKKK